MQSFLEVPETDWIASNDLAFAIRDGFPVSGAHTLVITRRVVASWFDATPAERAALLYLVDQVRSGSGVLEAATYKHDHHPTRSVPRASSQPSPVRRALRANNSVVAFSLRRRSRLPCLVPEKVLTAEPAVGFEVPRRRIMTKRYRTTWKFESELSKTTAELRSETEVILDGFDGDPMSKQQLEACIEMLQEISSKMRDPEPDEELTEDERD